MKKATLLAVLSLVVSCATGQAPRTYSFDSTALIQAPLNDVWSATVDAFAERNWPIDNIEKDSGLVTSDWMSMAPADSIADCGVAGGLSHIENRRMKFNVVVRPRDGATNLTVNTRAEATGCFGNTCGESYQCSSTGRIEKWFHETVRSRVEGA